MGNMICIIGVDGSGKTTLANNLIQVFSQNGIKTRYFHNPGNPLLLKPLAWLGRMFFLRKTNEHRDYREYRKTKRNAAKKYSLLSNIYSYHWLIYYSLYIFWNVSIPRLLYPNQWIFLDRYFYDVVINMSLNQERDLHWQELILSKWFRIFPKPDFVFLINIPHDEALRRKSDIPSIDFLVERQEHYRERAVAIQAVSLDGTLPQEKLVKVIISHVSSSIPVKEKLDVQTE